MQTRLGTLWLALVWTVGGCSLLRTEPVDYRTIDSSPYRNTDAAIREHRRALEWIAKGNWVHAERALQKALVADVTYAPAHNNLGQIYFQQGKMYLAAWEFEYAKELMEDRPEPYNNLGLVYEAVGRLDQAIEMFEVAHAQDPHHPEFMGNLARAKLRRGDQDPAIGQLLDELRFHDNRPDWVAWANHELAMGGAMPRFEIDAAGQPVSLGPLIPFDAVPGEELPRSQPPAEIVPLADPLPRGEPTTWNAPRDRFVQPAAHFEVLPTTPPFHGPAAPQFSAPQFSAPQFSAPQFLGPRYAEADR